MRRYWLSGVSLFALVGCAPLADQERTALIRARRFEAMLAADGHLIESERTLLA